MAVRSPSLLEDESHEEDSSRPGLPLDPGRVWLSIKRQWKILPAAVGTGAALGILCALFLVGHTFKTEAILIWEPAGGTASPGANRDLQTQAGILKTPAVLNVVRRKLKLAAPAHVVANQIQVWFDTESNLVTIETTSPTAQGAKDLAQTLMDAFFDHQRGLEKTRARELVALLKADQATALAASKEAEAAYDAFRAKHGVVDFEFESERALRTLETLREQREEAKADLGALDARAEQLTSLAKSQPRMRTASATRSDPTATRVASLRAELAEARARLAPDHPRLALLTAELAAAQKHAASGDSVVSDVTTVADPAFEQTRSSLTAARAGRAEAEQRLKSLDESIAKAQERVDRFAAIGGEAKKHISEIEQTAERVKELSNSLNRAREAERTTPLDFRVLTPPVVPEYPAGSRRKVVAVGITLLFTVLALAFLLLWPARDGRIHTAREAAFWTNTPVVGTSAWPRDPRSFKALVDELNDRAALSAGATLVVASHPHDRELAGALAASLGPEPTPMRFPVVDGTSPGPSQSTALVPRQGGYSPFFGWPGDSEGPSLRRAARISDRVLVVVRAGSETIVNAASLHTRLGRDTEVAVVLVDVDEQLLTLPDRVGNVDAFWDAATAHAA